MSLNEDEIKEILDLISMVRDANHDRWLRSWGPADKRAVDVLDFVWGLIHDKALKPT